MPELPDLEVYVDHLARRTVGEVLERVRIASPFLLRSVTPPISAAIGRRVVAVRRMAKRIVFSLQPAEQAPSAPESEAIHLVIHLMISGRFRWRDPGAGIPRRLGLAAFDFRHGTLLLTEAATKKRASLHVVQGEEALRALDPGGIEVLASDVATFRRVLESENHTLKRALTDPRLFAGIGNAYSDEILHRARLSPVRLTRQLDGDEVVRLYDATRAVLVEWTERLRRDAGDEFPEKVTAFRDDMAVHGRFGKPCPVCGTPVQRIRYSENEANYCARCQTGGKLLADRSLSRLLKDDWPKTLEELEERRAALVKDKPQDVGATRTAAPQSGRAGPPSAQGTGRTPRRRTR